MLNWLLRLNVIPDGVIRTGIRVMLRQRLKHEKSRNAAQQNEKLSSLITELGQSPIALNTHDANRQHYEVPASFFGLVLGNKLKYSCGLWSEDVHTLDESEIKMLDLTIRRAGINDGQQILDLGCGWGSFTLYAAGKFKHAHFTAVSNSGSQKVFIENKARALHLSNITVITSDINNFNPPQKFDRIVSVEMLEHVRNYAALFEKIEQWLAQNGQFFVHIFQHRHYAYKFEVKSNRDWMAKYFFTGGMMPSKQLFSNFTEKLKITRQWTINGHHYSKTLEAWLENMDNHKPEIMEIFRKIYEKQAAQFWIWWRIFFMACSETFRFNSGNEWQVGHYLFERQ
ncbi:MAG: class I SAM-dependent methyltransferase [Sphingobacteriia bacterium]|nr:class I SAM-dependent methyltransferase [Sphingobacteriia bacterium]